ncbi:MAG: type II secretion system protein [Planctomycetes bacterium]|nr:type II secretion system protein [Planctomycetota bacterium]
MKRGFTLVEMLVVMIVIATVTAVTVPAITRLNDEDELT